VHPYLTCLKHTFVIAFSTIVFASINKMIHKASKVYWGKKKNCRNSNISPCKSIIFPPPQKNIL
jgi:hypothetical protein